MSALILNLNLNEAICTYVRTYVCMYTSVHVSNTLATDEACPGTGSKVDWTIHTHSYTVQTNLPTYIHTSARTYVRTYACRSLDSVAR